MIPLEENLLRVNDIRPVLAAVREHGIALDPQYLGEVKRLFENPGVRVAYRKKHDGLTVDACGEMLWDRGFTVRRLDCREVLDLLEMLFMPRPKSRARVAVRTPRVVDEGERKARAMRNRKFTCEVCGQNARGTRSSSLICGVCFEMNLGDFVARVSRITGDEAKTRQIVAALASATYTLRRVDPLPEEIAAQAAGKWSVQHE